MLKTIIIEDEQNNLQFLKELLHLHFKELQVVGSAGTIQEGRFLIDRQRPDLLLLDIKLGQENSFSLLEHYNSPWFEVIFITAFDQYAIKAIRYCALDYLLKPINLQELKDALAKAADKILRRQENNRLRELVQYLKNPQLSPRIGLPGNNRVDFVEINQIVRCEGAANYTHVYLKDRKKLTVCKTLKDYEIMLQDHLFLRVHQSHLVNLAEVQSYLRADGGYLLLHDNSRIPVARYRKTEVLEKLALLGFK
jgi:two-component system LytT family response regulator